MSILKGKLALACVAAVAGLMLGCAQSRAAREARDEVEAIPVPPPEAPEQPETTLPKTPHAPPPGTQGTEMGTGGGGTYGGGMPSSTPTTTTPRSPSGPMPVNGDEEEIEDTQPGTGGSEGEVEPGTGGSEEVRPDQRQERIRQREDCIRNQIGSPASPGVVCPEEPSSSSSTSAEPIDTGIGTGGSGPVEEDPREPEERDDQVPDDMP